jgi:hypothetical protein
MYTVWHVDKYKIAFKLVIDHWPRARYRSAARRLRNTALDRSAIETGTSNIMRVIKSRRMKRAWHVARMGEMRNAYNILVGRPEKEEATWKT